MKQILNRNRAIRYHLIALVPLLVSFSTTTAQIPTEVPRSEGTTLVQRAADAVHQLYNDLPALCSPTAGSWSNVVITPNEFRFNGDILGGTNAKGNHFDWHVGSFSIGFDDIANAKVNWELCPGDKPTDPGAYRGAVIGLKSRSPAAFIDVTFRQPDAAHEFVGALLWLASHQHEIVTIQANMLAQHAASMEHFKQQAAGWRAAGSKVDPPEEAQRHFVLAQAAFQDKNFQHQAEELEAALEIYPTWPGRQSDLAVTLGELGRFSDAIEHMQMYLELVPDAPDAYKAKQQIWIWQDKLSQSQATAHPAAADQPTQSVKSPKTR